MANTMFTRNELHKSDFAKPYNNEAKLYFSAKITCRHRLCI